MRLPSFLLWPLRRIADRAMLSRFPDEVIRSNGHPYLERWWLLRTRLLRIYVHCFVGSDDVQASHDHPRASLSVVLHGCLAEIRTKQGKPAGEDLIPTGSVTYRPAKFSHRVVLVGRKSPAVTLFIFGPKVREWGYWCRRGWVHHTRYDRQGGC